jgi:hypothetical protein
MNEQKYRCEQCNEEFGHLKAPCYHSGAELATPMYRRALQYSGDISSEGYPPVYHCPCCGADQDPETGEWFWPYGYLGLGTWPREGHVWENGAWAPYPDELIWRGSLRAFLEAHRGTYFLRFSGRGIKATATEMVIQPPRSFGAMEGDDAYLWGIIHSYFNTEEGPAPCITFGDLTSAYIFARFRKICVS